MDLVMSIVPTIIFCILSLVAAYVLFKILKSNAGIKNPTHQMGGALAGFVIIFGLLSNVYYSYATIPLTRHKSIIKQKESEIEKLKEELTSITKKWVPKPWTICGFLVKEGSNSYKDILSCYQPPSPLITVIPEDGRFYLNNVKISEGGGWPTLLFQCKGYIPDEYKISNNIDTIDEKNFAISLRRKVVLEKMNH